MWWPGSNTTQWSRLKHTASHTGKCQRERTRKTLGYDIHVLQFEEMWSVPFLCVGVGESLGRGQEVPPLRERGTKVFSLPWAYIPLGATTLLNLSVATEHRVCASQQPLLLIHTIASLPHYLLIRLAFLIFVCHQNSCRVLLLWSNVAEAKWCQLQLLVGEN